MENEQYLKMAANNDNENDSESDSSEEETVEEKDMAKTSIIAKRRLSLESTQSRRKEASGVMSELELLDESVATAHSSTSSSSSSSDNSFTSPSTSKSPIKATTSSHHYCAYFQHDSAHQNYGCKHAKVIGQNVCPQCEFGRELSDSLDHMAFLSPTSSGPSAHQLADKYGYDMVKIQG